MHLATHNCNDLKIDTKNKTIRIHGKYTKIAKFTDFSTATKKFEVNAYSWKTYKITVQHSRQWDASNNSCNTPPPPNLKYFMTVKHMRVHTYIYTNKSVSAQQTLSAARNKKEWNKLKRNYNNKNSFASQSYLVKLRRLIHDGEAAR